MTNKASMPCTFRNRCQKELMQVFTCLAILKVACEQSTAEPSPTDVIKQIQPYAIVVGVGLLFFLLIINLVSVIQRRKDHGVIRSYLLSLHTLLPFLTRYDDIANLGEINTERRTSKSKQNSFGNHFEDYDEIGIVARRSKLKEMGDLDLKRIPEADESKKLDTSQEEKSDDRSTVYSLQKGVFSSNL
ncbi:uncharacterized protein LOC133204926 [Saccostrea echinata]|uniref:uncharacterized protein LOC133204926 n=1 Tax=Saccostrea echinata TaxID=191078 RepID=UPI002A7F742E|nr:uncharacterized protein LOC133204926 [Saccostrea echinata]